MSDRRCRQANFRVTEDELAAVDANARAAGMSRVEYFVHRCANPGDTIASRLYLQATEREKAAAIEPSRAADAPPKNGRADDCETGGRPRKSADGSRRTRQVKLTVSNVEHAYLKRYAELNDMSMTDYILGRTVYSKERTVPIVTPRLAAKVYLELTRQGTNLNQMAARVNRLHNLAFEEGVDHDAVNSLVDEIREDNRATRAHVNDALRSLTSLLDRHGGR